jgi:glyoxylase-like metal-dependent hydrolase (beta-lactamase superfamily II)
MNGSMKKAAVGSLAVATMLAAAGCSKKQQDPVQAAAQALDIANTQSIEYAGAGSWYQFGQAPAPSLAWPQYELSQYVADVNFETSSAQVQIARKQLVEPNRVRPVAVEQKPQQFVSGDVAWNLAVPNNTAPGTAPTVSPQFAAVEERQAEIWATPHGFLKAAIANHAIAKAIDGATEVSFTLDGKYHYVGILNAKNEVERVQTWIDNPILGDTLVETRYSAYNDFDGVKFPSHIERTQGSHKVFELDVKQVKRNPGVDIAVPLEVAQAKAAPVVDTEIAKGVHYLTGGSHHSVAIEQKDHVVVVEAPLDEARSLAVIAKVKEVIPNKPIKYLINTHQHFDHSGGLRSYVDEGSTIVTHEGNVEFYKTAWAAPHSIHPDRLSESKKTASFEPFTAKHVLSDGARTIEVHEIAGNTHNDAFALVYLPAEKILIEADAYTPLPAGSPAPANANPYSVNLYENLQKLSLDVEQIAALHGPGAVALNDLKLAIGKSD